MPAPHYDIPQIIAWVGSRSVALAYSYSEAVSQVTWQDGTLTGKVQGTESRPYEVRVHFHDSARGVWAEGACTCPVRLRCKHMAAVLIAGRSMRDDKLQGVRPELQHWLDAFRASRRPPEPKRKAKAARAQFALAYLIGVAHAGYTEVVLYKARRRSDGRMNELDGLYTQIESALLKPPQFVSEEDLGILRGLWLTHLRGDPSRFALRGANGAAILEKLIPTGRAFVMAGASRTQPATGVALRSGPPRPARIDWRAISGDRIAPTLSTDPPAIVVSTTLPLWYLDPKSHEAGVVEMAWPTAQLAGFLSMPPISLEEADLVAGLLHESAPEFPAPPRRGHDALRVVDCVPVPHLTLDTVAESGPPLTAVAREGRDFATVSFQYEDVRVEAQDTRTLTPGPDGGIVEVKRRRDDERARLSQLQRAGFVTLQPGYIYGVDELPVGALGLRGADAWATFMSATVPALRDSGWRVTLAEGFRFNVVEIEAIEGDLRRSGDGWFDVEMGITIGDRTVRLEPLLADLFARDPRWLTGGLDGIDDAEAVELKTDRGERLRLRALRLKPVVRVLLDLLEPGASLRIREWDVGRLAALEDTARWRFHGEAVMRELAQRLLAGPGVRDVAVPDGLRADLRPYQRQGLSWMQFLREHGLSGVLADDMGLGKTVQALAHLLVEKEAGRLTRPALVIVPTTLVHNWMEEAGRFAPSLRVLNLHGAQRSAGFDRITAHDLVITTYSLLWRDEAVLGRHEYHLLILDEAQYVKNAATKSATTIRQLRATHRLCLTGTPLENHLGELWSQFDFLLPGFLGTQRDFTQRWRSPIEKGGDTARRDLLARRVRPFMLRRTKDQVARELPPKTLILRTVDLEGAQRDLYEAVRSMMQDKVRAAVKSHGLGRSRILVLDALLKLRQVCCDPRLLKLEHAHGVPESSKLELLKQMIPELIDEGRRILLFSQFTGMLALIAAELDAAGIGYVTLTGDTTDRVAPVKRFERGEVPVFLISLKAGGVGLNLTAADTVVHYDPWWNPAAENQATDRAHRIGQDKPVFVYKLIAAGSIEEKIVALQERKAALAEAVLSGEGTSGVQFSADDLEALFAPIPELPRAPGEAPR